VAVAQEETETPGLPDMPEAAVVPLGQLQVKPLPREPILSLLGLAVLGRLVVVEMQMVLKVVPHQLPVAT
tara:strand:+ start:1404 stop:1613 length:210 start_codon:yes stop_codon:yes gene_type:complete